jgi:hypothetical protein
MRRHSVFPSRIVLLVGRADAARPDTVRPLIGALRRTSIVAYPIIEHGVIDKTKDTIAGMARVLRPVRVRAWVRAVNRALETADGKPAYERISVRPPKGLLVVENWLVLTSARSVAA